jgi:hypothetical protein
MSDADRAMLIAMALVHLEKAQKALQAAGDTSVSVRLGIVQKACRSAYTLATGRDRPEVRCLHGTLLTRPCKACEVAAIGARD